MSSQNHLEIYLFLDYDLVVFWTGQKAETEFAESSDPWKIVFSISQVAFCDVQKAESKFGAPGDLLSRRYFDLDIYFCPNRKKK